MSREVVQCSLYDFTTTRLLTKPTYHLLPAGSTRTRKRAGIVKAPSLTNTYNFNPQQTEALVPTKQPDSSPALRDSEPPAPVALPQHREISPLDAYVDIGLAFKLDEVTISTMRQHKILEGLERTTAIERLFVLQRELSSAEVLQEFLRNLSNPLQSITPQVLTDRLTARINRLMMVSPREIDRKAAQRIIACVPATLLADHERFSALINSLFPLLPNVHTRGEFIQAYPRYFTLDPTRVATFIHHSSLDFLNCASSADIWEQLRGFAEHEQRIREFLSGLGMTGPRVRTTMLYIRRRYPSFTHAHEAISLITRTPGWDRKNLQYAFSNASYFLSVTADIIIERQQWLQTRYAFDPQSAAKLCCKCKVLLNETTACMEAKLAIALGPDASPEQQRNFIEKYAYYLAQTEQWLSRWNARQNPAPKPTEDAESDLPPIIIPDGTDAVLRAFLKNRWNQEEARAHLNTFPSLKEIDPDILAASLRLLRTHFDFSDAAFTKLLQKRLSAFAVSLYTRPFDQLHANRNEQTELDAEAVNAEVRIYAASIHQITGSTLRTDNFMRCMDFLRRKKVDAKKLVREAPELLIHQGVPIDIARQLAETFGLADEIVLFNLSQCRRILFEVPEMVAPTIRKHHAILAEHAPRNSAMGSLSPTVCWDWFYFPEPLLIRRLQQLQEKKLETLASRKPPKKAPWMSPIAHLVYHSSPEEFQKRLRRGPAKDSRAIDLSDDEQDPETE